MKKILIMASVVCCMMIITGCDEKKNTKVEYKTTCEHEFSDGSSFVYTYTHDKNIIANVFNSQTYFFEDISSAIDEENNQESICKQLKKDIPDFLCDVSRTDKIVFVNTTHKCLVEEECNYEDTIKEMGKKDYVCVEKTEK